ncbi:MAG TPA: hypothetical protein PK544_08650 [Spirochaetota bacterium]|nr:hypothetical protein [Spirochaetota bacterium]
MKRSSRRNEQKAFNPDKVKVCEDFIYAKKELKLDNEAVFFFLVAKHSGGKTGVQKLSDKEILRRTNLMVEIVNEFIEKAKNLNISADHSSGTTVQ